jgi:hypothetical protein
MGTISKERFSFALPAPKHMGIYGCIFKEHFCRMPALTMNPQLHTIYDFLVGFEKKPLQIWHWLPPFNQG